MNRSAKYLLKPTKGQARKLDHLLWMQRNLYNDALAERKAAWDTEGRAVGLHDQQRALKMSDADPALVQYGSRVARGTLVRVDEAFQGFFRRCDAGASPGYPRFLGHSRWCSVYYPDATAGWKLVTDARRLYLQGIGHVRIRMHRLLPGRPKTLVIKRQGTRWWAVIVCDQVPARLLLPTGRQVGIDLGVASVLTTSDGEHIANPRFANRAAANLATAERRKASKVVGSNRRRKLIVQIGAHHRKVVNCRRDYAHQLSRRLVNDFDLIAHEDLAIRNMTARPEPRPDGAGGWLPNGAAAKTGLNDAILDVGWARLLRFVTYKAECAGRDVIAVDPRNTSRTCSSCGHCEKGNRLTQAKFVCLSCGYVAHADENAAVNILRAGLALHREKCEVREEAGCDDVPSLCSSLANPGP